MIKVARFIEKRKLSIHIIFLTNTYATFVYSLLDKRKIELLNRYKFHKMLSFAQKKNKFLESARLNLLKKIYLSTLLGQRFNIKLVLTLKIYLNTLCCYPFKLSILIHI